MLLIAAAAASCTKESAPVYRSSTDSASRQEDPSGGQEYEPFSRDSIAVLLYSAAYNNLVTAIKDNIRKIGTGQIPVRDSRKKLLIFAHFARLDNRLPDYDTPMASHLVRVYAGEGNLVVKDPVTGAKDTLIRNVHCDTLLTVNAARTACDPAVLREVLEFVGEEFPRHKYGLVLSSHGTGWLPVGVYGSYGSMTPVQLGKRKPYDGWPLYLYNQDPSVPAVRTFGAEAFNEGSKTYCKEMGITSLAAAIPMRLSFMIFDACLMGCVEVAYELRNVTDKICFSPTEILAEGMDYAAYTDKLLARGNLEGYAEAYYRHYENASYNRYATVSVVRTDGLENLAQTCRELADTYRDRIDTVGTNVQKYYRAGNSWFYDLQDIFVQCRISPADEKKLQDALDAAITYKAATDKFFDLSMDRFSGLGMYLPNRAVKSLKTKAENYYRNLAWNKAVNLVE